MNSTTEICEDKERVKLRKEMLVQSGHLEETTEYSIGESNFCPFHKKEGHHIDECIEFHQKVARMLTL